MNYTILKDIIELLESYEQSPKTENSVDSTQQFLRWALAKQESPPKHIKIPESIPTQGNASGRISQLIALLFKYVKFYFRKGFKNLELKTIDDFGFLATLALFGDLRKSELIEKNTMEFPSGMDVIKRLEKKQLVTSFADPNDKRATRIKISPKGQGLFFKILPTLEQIGQIATGPLSEEEKNTLLFLMEKLNHFHNPIFHKEKQSSITNIHEQYVKTTSK